LLSKFFIFTPILGISKNKRDQTKTLVPPPRNKENENSRTVKNPKNDPADILLTRKQLLFLQPQKATNRKTEAKQLQKTQIASTLHL